MLRNKGATKLSKLPQGVFRCLLEYQLDSLFWRYSEPYMPIRPGKQNRHFPAIEKLNYNNELVALNEIPEDVEY